MHILYKRAWERLTRELLRLPFGEQFLRDAMFRAGIFLYASLGLNLLFAVVQFITSLRYRSMWAGALAVYYVLLAVMRFLLLRPGLPGLAPRDQKTELRQYRLCGVVLLLMTPVFVSILILVIQRETPTGYSKWMLHLMAVYALVKVSVAIFNVCKFRDCGNPVMTAAKTLALISALVSLLSLEAAMLYRFGDQSISVFTQGMIGTSGGAVCLYALGRAISMVVTGTKAIKECGGASTLRKYT